MTSGLSRAFNLLHFLCSPARNAIHRFKNVPSYPFLQQIHQGVMAGNSCISERGSDVAPGVCVDPPQNAPPLEFIACASFAPCRQFVSKRERENLQCQRGSVSATGIQSWGIFAPFDPRRSLAHFDTAMHRTGQIKNRFRLFLNGWQIARLTASSNRCFLFPLKMRKADPGPPPPPHTHTPPPFWGLLWCCPFPKVRCMLKCVFLFSFSVSSIIQ